MHALGALAAKQLPTLINALSVEIPVWQEQFLQDSGGKLQA